MSLWSRLREFFFPPEERPSAGRTEEARDSAPKEESRSLDRIVGLDFGTSSTKVVVGDPIQDRSYFLGIDAACAGFPEGSAPTTVRLADGAVLLGSQAELGEGGEVFRSFKVCLACTPGTPDCRDCPTWERKWKPIEITTLYLAWVTSEVESRLQDKAGNHQLALTWNMGAPLSELSRGDDEGESRRLAAFSLALRSGLSLRENVSQRMPENEAHRMVRAALQEQAAESLDEIGAAVIPEPLAPLMALQQARKLYPGLVILVDVGAGSTEVSVVRHVSGEGAREIFYADSTTLRGGDLVAWAHKGDSSPVSFSELGELRQLVQAASADDVHPAEEEVASLIRKAYVRCFGRAYGKESREKAWRDVEVVFVGGGTHLQAVKQAFKKHAWIDKWSWRSERDFRWRLSWFDPQDALFDIDSPREVASLGGDARFFTVALGLSTHPLDYPDFDRPGELDGLPEREEAERIETDRW